MCILKRFVDVVLKYCIFSLQNSENKLKCNMKQMHFVAAILPAIGMYS